MKDLEHQDYKRDPCYSADFAAASVPGPGLSSSFSFIILFAIAVFALEKSQLGVKKT